jgi:hypothetical protein
VIEKWGNTVRAIDCAVPGCQHLHAEDDDALGRLLLRHTHQAHPGVRMEEPAAEARVEEASYEDKKHAKRTTFAGALRNDDGGGIGPGMMG